MEFSRLWKQKKGVEGAEQKTQITHAEKPAVEDFSVYTNAELNQKYDAYMNEARTLERNVEKIFVWPPKKAEMRNRLENIYARLDDIRRALQTPEEQRVIAWTTEQQSPEAARSVLQQDTQQTEEALTEKNAAFFAQEKAMVEMQRKLAFFSPDVLIPLQQENARTISARVAELDRMNAIVTTEQKKQHPQSIEEIATEAYAHPEQFGLERLPQQEWKAIFSVLREKKRQFENEVRLLQKQFAYVSLCYRSVIHDTGCTYVRPRELSQAENQQLFSAIEFNHELQKSKEAQRQHVPYDDSQLQAYRKQRITPLHELSPEVLRHAFSVIESSIERYQIFIRRISQYEHDTKRATRSSEFTNADLQRMEAQAKALQKEIFLLRRQKRIIDGALLLNIDPQERAWFASQQLQNVVSDLERASVVVDGTEKQGNRMAIEGIHKTASALIVRSTGQSSHASATQQRCSHCVT